MPDSRTILLHRAVFRILRPLARLLLRNGVAYGEFADLMKRAYVQSAFEDFAEGKRRTTDSRAAVMTGLTRKDIKHQRELLTVEQGQPASRSGYSRVSRVISGWVHDAHYHASNGQPAVLSFDGAGGFSDLVRRYSGDMTPKAILGELLRANVVSVDPQTGCLTLLQRSYVAPGDSEEMLQFFGEDVADLITTIGHNLRCPETGDAPRLQRTLTYSNIPPEVMEQWRAHAASRSQALLEDLDQWLGPKDRDIADTDDTSGAAYRTGISVFYFEQSDEN